MKLKHGKKYETADGVAYRVEKRDQPLDDLTFESSNCYYNDFGEAIGIGANNNLVRRHYKKPQPAHKLDLKPGDVVELVAWEDYSNVLVGKSITIEEIGLPSGINGYCIRGYPKGQRPLFKVVSRA